MHYFTPDLFIYLSLLLSVEAIFASDCTIPQSRPSNENYTRICLPAMEVNRTFAISTTSPIATSLNFRPWASYGLLQLLAHFESEAHRIRALARQRPPKYETPRTYVCNINININIVGKDTPYDKVNRTLSEVGFGILSRAKPCATEIDTDRQHTPVAAITAFLREVKAVGLEAAYAAGLNWSAVHLYQSYTYKDTFDVCHLTRLSAVRVDGKWAIHTAITNHKHSSYKQPGRRENLIEFLHLGLSGNVEALPMVLQERINGTDRAGRWILNASTLLEIRGDVHGTSLFDERSIPAENSAVLAAIHMRAHQRQQAHAYTRYSQISIFLLPIITSLIPVSMFTDLNSPIVYLYTVSKDIVSAIPLIIKGAELILFGRGIKPQATRTRFYGGLTETDLAVAETWFAVCNANQRVVLIGQALIIAAVLITVAGIAIERSCMRLAQSRRAMAIAHRITGKDSHMWRVAEIACEDCGCFIDQTTTPLHKSPSNRNVEVLDSFM